MKAFKRLNIIMADDPKAVADTIIRQLGGFGKLKAMIAANKFFYNKEPGEYYTLSFEFKGNPKFKMCKIIYSKPKDLYTVQFFGKNYLKNKEIEDVYNNQLKDVFEKTTGLALSL